MDRDWVVSRAVFSLVVGGDVSIFSGILGEDMATDVKEYRSTIATGLHRKLMVSLGRGTLYEIQSTGYRTFSEDISPWP